MDINFNIFIIIYSILLGILTKIWRTWDQELNSLLRSSGTFWLDTELLKHKVSPRGHGYKTNKQLNAFKVFSIHSLQTLTVTYSKTIILHCVKNGTIVQAASQYVKDYCFPPIQQRCTTRIYHLRIYQRSKQQLRTNLFLHQEPERKKYLFHNINIAWWCFTNN